MTPTIRWTAGPMHICDTGHGDSCWVLHSDYVALLARANALELALQNYMDACAYADKDTLVAAIGAAHKEAVSLIPRRVYSSIRRETRTGAGHANDG